MRSRWHETGHEAEFRDGLHGALVWAGGVLISAVLVFATAGVVAKTGADLAGKAAGSVASSSDAMDAVLDTMLRPASIAQTNAPTAPTASRQEVPPRAQASDETRAEVSRILTSSVASGSIAPENRTRLAQLVSQRAGISQQEAERRVDDAVNAARAAADKARRAAVLTGFVTAAALILSLGAGWWAAMRGGHHRDTSVPARFILGDRRRTSVT